MIQIYSNSAASWSFLNPNIVSIEFEHHPRDLRNPDKHMVRFTLQTSLLQRVNFAAKLALFALGYILSFGYASSCRTSAEKSYRLLTNTAYQLGGFVDLSIMSTTKLTTFFEGEEVSIAKLKETLCDDDVFGAKVVNLDSDNLKYLSPRLRSCKTIGLIVVNSVRPLSIQNATEVLLDNEDFMTQAIEKSGNVYQHASTKLKGRENLLKLAAKTFPKMIEYAPDLLKQSDGLMLEILRTNPNAIESIPDQFKADRNFMLEAIKLKPSHTQHASDVLKKDEGFILSALRLNIKIMKFLPAEVKKKKSMVLKALTINANTFSYIDDGLKSNSAFLRDAVIQNQEVYTHLPPQRQFDPIIVKALKNPAILINTLKMNKKLSDSFLENDRGDKKKMLYEVTLNPEALPLASEELQKDLNFLKTVLEQQPHAYKYVDESMRTNREIQNIFEQESFKRMLKNQLLGA